MSGFGKVAPQILTNNHRGFYGARLLNLFSIFPQIWRKIMKCETFLIFVFYRDIYSVSQKVYTLWKTK